MKLKTLLIGTILTAVTFAAVAQQANDDNRRIIYKWHQSGKTHYAEWPPHGISNYQRLNNQGMVLNEIPDLESFLVIRPDRPTTQQVAEEKKSSSVDERLNTRAGTITRQKRCEAAQKNLKTISEKQTIYEEDQTGNLIPLSKEEVASRREQAQNEVENFCSEPKTTQETQPR